MTTKLTNHSKAVFMWLLTLLLAVSMLTMYGCSDQAVNSDLTTDTDITQLVASPGPGNSDDETIEETMQISPHMLNLQANGTAESIRAIIGLYIPGSYHLTDYDFTLSFDGVDVTYAYDCYYCYVDNNLIISFDKTDVQTSQVTLDLINTVVVAGVDGYFRVESETDGYETTLSTIAQFEIISPSQATTLDEMESTELGN